jgi:hypothetical protein
MLTPQPPQNPIAMQASLSRTAARHRRPLTRSTPRNLLMRLGSQCADFVMHDRDRWVPVTCAAGFALLMWVDWLAA